MLTDFLFVFSSTHQSLQAKKIVASLHIDYELIATPREISSECGFCILIYQQNEVKVNAIIKKINNPEIVVYQKNEKGVSRYEKSS